MPEFPNILSYFFGGDGDPLYVISEDKALDNTTTFQYFMDKCVACELFNGPSYDYDKRSIHHFFVLFI